MHCEHLLCCTGFHFNEGTKTCSLGDQTINNYHRNFRKSFYTDNGNKDTDIKPLQFSAQEVLPFNLGAEAGGEFATFPRDLRGTRLDIISCM